MMNTVKSMCPAALAVPISHDTISPHNQTYERSVTKRR
jgi:hypothetical protein